MDSRSNWWCYIKLDISALDKFNYNIDSSRIMLGYDTFYNQAVLPFSRFDVQKCWAEMDESAMKITLIMNEFDGWALNPGQNIFIRIRFQKR